MCCVTIKNWSITSTDLTRMVENNNLVKINIDKIERKEKKKIILGQQS
jgi:hypothetical protein